MKIEVILLGKNFYEFEGQKGANLVVFGELEETNNKAGISISEASIEYDEHHLVNTFPAKYSATAQLVSIKSRSNKNVTSLKLSDLKLVEELHFVKKSFTKEV